MAAFFPSHEPWGNSVIFSVTSVSQIQSRMDFLCFYLLIALHTEDEKCSGCEAGKDSSFEDVLWNEKSQ